MHEGNAKARDRNLEFIFRQVLRETFTEGGYQRRKCGKRERRRQTLGREHVEREDEEGMKR